MAKEMWKFSVEFAMSLNFDAMAKSPSHRKAFAYIEIISMSLNVMVSTKWLPACDWMRSNEMYDHLSKNFSSRQENKIHCINNSNFCDWGLLRNKIQMEIKLDPLARQLLKLNWYSLYTLATFWESDIIHCIPFETD